MRRELFALFAAAALLLGMSACTTVDNPSSGGGNAQEEPVVAPAQLKQGIWTEYDEALLTSGKYTEEQLAQMPAVAMWIEGDKGYFFTYTGEETSEPVEGQVSYDNTKGKGSITFPTIEDNPLSDQTVSFSMTTDETMEFELSYGGQTTTATFAWLCENFDNWSSDITDEDWLALMADYQLIPETAGPDASIDWSKSVEVEDIDDNGNPVKVEVKDLDKPLVWEEDAVAPARTRAIEVGTVVSVGLKILGALFKDDSSEKKLDAITEKVDKVLQGQQEMLNKLNELNNRLTAIAEQMQKQATIDIINERNKTYYNPLKVRNRSYFDDAYELYTTKKNELSQEDKKNLGRYAEKWVGSNNEYINLTWQYMEYLTTVQHSTYGTGMDKIYDGIIYDEYPWEHLGTEDRKSYRGTDLLMITKCLFMICLYSTYCNLDDIDKKALYNNYNEYRPQLEKFCEFTVANPDEFRVCQIPGAHFVMHKELQKYNYKGANNEAPHPAIYGPMAVYRPEWHEAGSIKIENPEKLRTSLLSWQDAQAIYKYYKSAVYPKNSFDWYEVFATSDMGAGAVFAKEPDNYSPGTIRFLLYDRDEVGGVENYGIQNDLYIRSVSGRSLEGQWSKNSLQLGITDAPQNGKALWRNNGNDYLPYNYYAAIVAERFD